MMLKRVQGLSATCFKLARASSSASFSTVGVPPGYQVTEKPATDKRLPGERLTPDWKGEKMAKRHGTMFDRFDKNGNGVLTLDEIIYKASVEICGNIGATPRQTQAHTEAVTAFFGPGGLEMQMGVETTKEEFINNWEKLTHEELDRWAKLEPTLLFNWGEVIFDIIDTSNSGCIDLHEWTKYQEAALVAKTPADSLATFKVCDLNQDGKIEVLEMAQQHIGFWYCGTVDGLYGTGVP